jgi:HlyD family secretion protein
MTVSIDIETARRADALTVPADAVRDAARRQPWALVVRDGRVQRQEVELGARSDGRIEIRSGIVAGEQLVPASQPALPPGSRVRAVAG